MPITDWDDAYANGPNIPAGDQWPARWVGPAEAFRAVHGGERDIAYGAGERHVLDLFGPQGEPKGLVVFVHGGFWVKLDKSYWSHLAGGALAQGWAVAVPSYPLCPDAGIGEIVRAIGAAIETAAGMVAGPIRLAGHSAGGHLATSMICEDTPLSPAVLDRIVRVVSISGLHDLRPLLNTKLNDDLRLTAETAAALSPALKRPAGSAELVTWVGAGERSEFIRQSRLMANIWTGLGMRVAEIEEPDRHHFNILDSMADPQGALTVAITGAI